MTVRKTTTYGLDLWKQGTRGEESPLLGRAKITNMQTYTSGLLGPRPKFKAFYSYTGGTIYDNYTVGNVAYLTDPSRHMISSGTAGSAVTDIELGTQYLTWTGSVRHTIFHLLDVQYAQAISTGGSKLVTLSEEGPGSPPFTPTTSTIDLDTAYTYNNHFLIQALVWQGRAWYLAYGYATGTDVTPVSNRLHYSDLYDFDAFTDSGFIDMDDGPIIGMKVIDNDLVCWSRQGKFYRLSSAGGPVTDIAVSPMQDGRVPFPESENLYYTDVKVDGVTFFLSFFSQPSIVCALEGKGVDDKALRHLITEVYPALPHMPAGSSESNAIYLPYREYGGGSDYTTDTGPLYGYVFFNGAWWNDVSLDFSVDDDDHLIGTGMGYDYDAILFVFHSWDTGGSPAEYSYGYTRDLSLDRPSKDGDTWSNGDEEMYVDGVLSDVTQSGSVHLPRIQAQSTSEYVRVGKVTIDGQYWKDAGGNYPTVAVTVSVVDQEGTTNTFTSDLSAGSLSNAEPGSIRITATFDSARFTPWSEVRLDGIDSLAIENVHVDFEVEDRSW